MKLQNGDKLLFIGDSITDCNRRRPRGEGINALGNGYVSLIDSFLQSTYPERKIRITNMGTGGETIRDLKARWENDVFSLQPDWVSMMIGTNDVWRQFDMPLFIEGHVYIEEYEQTLKELVEQTRSTVKGLILMTPFFLEGNLEDPMCQMIDQYAEVVKKVARENDCIFIDTQAAFQKLFIHLYPVTLSLGWDRIHPTQAGHMTIAKAWLNSIGFDYNR